MTRPARTALGAGAAAVLALAGCHVFQGKPEAPAPAAPPPLPVKRAAEEVVVAAWAEPKRLPPMGGSSQILVRLRKRGGAPYQGVEVRLQTSAGRLFSGGKVLLTDGAGQTRDRLTTSRAAEITLNAGGTIYRFHVPVGPPPER